MALFGCDTFVVFPPLTKDGDIIFGKNSDRPKGEVQEVIYNPNSKFVDGDKLQCTYIVIDQVLSTHAVLLSKPAWMWGAEMGANDCGVVIGNEAVWTVVDDDMHTERLLGMDLVRLGLERASTSIEAVMVITSLLEKHGQGGACSDTDSGLHYHNSFLIADHKEAWVLETAGRLWVAERVADGYRNISNTLSIGSSSSKMSSQLLNFAKKQKLWDGKGEFNFKKVFSSNDCPREAAGQKLLRDLTSDSKFDITRMFQILRDKESNICRPADDPFHTSGSWVSVLSRPTVNSRKPACHWVTCSPDPSVSVFKPFIFTRSSNISPATISPAYANDPAKEIPRFQFKVDRRHTLYKLHETSVLKETVLKNLKELENSLLNNTSNILSQVENGTYDIEACNELFKSAVEMEIKVYTT